MEHDDTVKAEGTVLERLPNQMYRVELDTGQKVTAHVSGDMRANFVRILPGDRVWIELSPYDAARGRVVGKSR